jgi:hypothetical protein
MISVPVLDADSRSQYVAVNETVSQKEPSETTCSWMKKGKDKATPQQNRWFREESPMAE